MLYDPNNVFAKIIRGEISCNRVYENEHVLAFHDLSPQAPIHILIIPKKPYRSFDDFSAQASAEEMVSMTKAVGEIARLFNLQKEGYRCLTNHGAHAGQEIFHYHVHLCAGRPLGKLLSS